MIQNIKKVDIQTNNLQGRMLKVLGNNNKLMTVEVDVLTRIILETMTIVNLLRSFQQQIDKKQGELNNYMKKYQLYDMLDS